MKFIVEKRVGQGLRRLATDMEKAFATPRMHANDEKWDISERCKETVDMLNLHNRRQFGDMQQKPELRTFYTWLSGQIVCSICYCAVRERIMNTQHESRLWLDYMQPRLAAIEIADDVVAKDETGAATAAALKEQVIAVLPKVFEDEYNCLCKKAIGIFERIYAKSMFITYIDRIMEDGLPPVEKFVNMEAGTARDLSIGKAISKLKDGMQVTVGDIWIQSTFAQFAAATEQYDTFVKEYGELVLEDLRKHYDAYDKTNITKYDSICCLWDDLFAVKWKATDPVEECPFYGAPFSWYLFHCYKTSHRPCERESMSAQAILPAANTADIISDSDVDLEEIRAHDIEAIDNVSAMLVEYSMTEPAWTMTMLSTKLPYAYTTPIDTIRKAGVTFARQLFMFGQIDSSDAGISDELITMLSTETGALQMINDIINYRLIYAYTLEAADTEGKLHSETDPTAFDTGLPYTWINVISMKTLNDMAKTVCAPHSDKIVGAFLRDFVFKQQPKQVIEYINQLLWASRDMLSTAPLPENIMTTTMWHVFLDKWPNEDIPTSPRFYKPILDNIKDYANTIDEPAYLLWFYYTCLFTFPWFCAPTAIIQLASVASLIDKTRCVNIYELCRVYVLCAVYKAIELTLARAGVKLDAIIDGYSAYMTELEEKLLTFSNYVEELIDLVADTVQIDDRTQLISHSLQEGYEEVKEHWKSSTDASTYAKAITSLICFSRVLFFVDAMRVNTGKTAAMTDADMNMYLQLSQYLNKASKLPVFCTPASVMTPVMTNPTYVEIRGAAEDKMISGSFAPEVITFVLGQYDEIVRCLREEDGVHLEPYCTDRHLVGVSAFGRMQECDDAPAPNEFEKLFRMVDKDIDAIITAVRIEKGNKRSNYEFVAGIIERTLESVSTSYAKTAANAQAVLGGASDEPAAGAVANTATGTATALLERQADDIVTSSVIDANGAADTPAMNDNAGAMKADAFHPEYKDITQIHKEIAETGTCTFASPLPVAKNKVKAEDTEHKAEREAAAATMLAAMQKLTTEWEQTESASVAEAAKEREIYKLLLMSDKDGAAHAWSAMEYPLFSAAYDPYIQSVLWRVVQQPDNYLNIPAALQTHKNNAVVLTLRPDQQITTLGRKGKTTWEESRSLLLKQFAADGEFPLRLLLEDDIKDETIDALLFAYIQQLLIRYVMNRAAAVMSDAFMQVVPNDLCMTLGYAMCNTKTDKAKGIALSAQLDTIYKRVCNTARKGGAGAKGLIIATLFKTETAINRCITEMCQRYAADIIDDEFIDGMLADIQTCVNKRVSKRGIKQNAAFEALNMDEYLRLFYYVAGVPMSSVQLLGNTKFLDTYNKIYEKTFTLSVTLLQLVQSNDLSLMTIITAFSPYVTGRLAHTAVAARYKDDEHWQDIFWSSTGNELTAWLPVNASLIQRIPSLTAALYDVRTQQLAKMSHKMNVVNGALTNAYEMPTLDEDERSELDDYSLLTDASGVFFELLELGVYAAARDDIEAYTSKANAKNINSSLLDVLEGLSAAYDKVLITRRVFIAKLLQQVPQRRIMLTERNDAGKVELYTPSIARMFAVHRQRGDKYDAVWDTTSMQGFEDMYTKQYYELLKFAMRKQAHIELASGGMERVLGKQALDEYKRMQEMCDKAAAVQVEFERQSKALQDAEAMIATLRAQLEAEKAKPTKTDERVATLTSTLKNKNEELRKANDATATAKNEAEQWRKKYEALTAEHAAMSRDYAELRKYYDAELERELDNESGSVATMHRKYAKQWAFFQSVRIHLVLPEFFAKREQLVREIFPNCEICYMSKDDSKISLAGIEQAGFDYYAMNMGYCGHCQSQQWEDKLAAMKVPYDQRIVWKKAGSICGLCDALIEMKQKQLEQGGNY